MARDLETNKQAEATPVGSAGEEVFRTVFLLYYRPIRSFFSKRGFKSTECQDLTQETFLRVYRGMEGFRQESSLKNWIFAIAANIYRNEVRGRMTGKRSAEEVSLDEVREQGQPLFLSNDLGVVEAEGLNDLLGWERAQMLRAALRDLPPRRRQCVLLRLDQGLSNAEIGKCLGISIETVKTHLVQARKTLREKLQEYFTDFDA